MRCQSEPRLPFHLPFLPMTEEGGRREGGSTATLPTHTLVTLHSGSSAGEVGSQSTTRFSPSLSAFFPDCFTTFAFISPHPSSSEDVRKGVKAAYRVAHRLVKVFRTVFSSKSHLHQLPFHLQTVFFRLVVFTSQGLHWTTKELSFSDFYDKCTFKKTSGNFERDHNSPTAVCLLKKRVMRF